MTIVFETLKGKQRRLEEDEDGQEERQPSMHIQGTKKGVPKKWARPRSTVRDLGMALLPLLEWTSDRVTACQRLRDHLASLRESSGLSKVPAEDAFLKSILCEKLQSYRDQDESQGKRLECRAAAEDQLIHRYEEVIQQLLIDTNAICYYCHQPVSILYEYTYDDRQWSLDRWNNFQPHVLDNVLLSCLRCNVNRGCQSSYLYHQKHQSKVWSIVSCMESGPPSTPPPVEAEEEEGGGGSMPCP